MITLSQIWVYPVKSLPGVSVTEAEIDDRGLVGDRRFMLVGPEGRFVTQRQYPQLAALSASLESDRLRIARPDGAFVELPTEGEGPSREVTIWKQTVRAMDMGEEAADLLGGYLGRTIRLVRIPAATRRPADPGFAREGDLVAFQDGFAFLLISEGSLDALNARLGRPVDMRRFRPNLVVRGAEAFAEDEWGAFELGGVSLRAQKPCSRCLMVDVDPDTAVRRRGVLAELTKFRKQGDGVYFGQNLVHDGPGRVRVGDPLTLVS